MTNEEPGLDIWGFLQRRKSFVILFAIAGAGLGYLYFQRQVPRFSSNALMQIVHHHADARIEKIIAQQNLSDAEFVITSPKLLVPCVEKYSLTQLDTLRGNAPDDAARIMAEMISSESLAANILQLSCTGPDAGDTAQIANAVAQEYIAHEKENYDDAISKLAMLLTKAKDELRHSIERLETEFAEFDELSPLMSDGHNVHRDRLADINQRLSDVVIRQTERKAELMGLEQALHNGGQREALMLLVDKQVERKSGESPVEVEDAVTHARSMFEALMPLLMEEAMLSEELGSQHPRLQALRKRIEITRDQFDMLSGLTPGKNSKENQKPRTDFLSIYLNSLRQEIRLDEMKHEEFRNLSELEEQAAKDLRKFEHQRANYISQIARENSLLEDVQAQIRDTQLPTNMGGISATILTEARHGALVYPKLPEFLGMGAFLGAFAGLALGYVVEMADRSFRKPEEIIREFGVPIVGHIPYMQEQKLRKIPKDTTIDRTVISLHLPRSRPAEAYRSVRTAVCFSAIGNKHRVIQVTSPAAGDGKSTLAMNFAVSMAQSGKKTIIVESDFRRPKVHKLTGVDNKVGLVDVLRGDADLPDAIKETELEGFYVMPCGSRPRNPSELLTRPEYEQVISMLREKFEYVIIDTPPVLVVTDPCSVGPRVDGVLLCVRLSRHTRDFGRRSLEQLRDVGANMTGIVVNGVEETDAYGYGNYSYSDYRYRYKDYNYGYEKKGDESYFADAEDLVSASRE